MVSKRPAMATPVAKRTIAKMPAMAKKPDMATRAAKAVAKKPAMATPVAKKTIAKRPAILKKPDRATSAAKAVAKKPAMATSVTKGTAPKPAMAYWSTPTMALATSYGGSSSTTLGGFQAPQDPNTRPIGHVMINTRPMSYIGKRGYKWSMVGFQEIWQKCGEPEQE